MTDTLDQITAISHESKAQPGEILPTKIVSAYGLRKCPKLVEQIAGDDLEVRINALKVLCEEMHNPYSVYLCSQAGVVSVLSAMVCDPDFSTRLYSSKALAIMAKDSNGLDAILHDEAVNDILLGKSDPHEEVRDNVFTCLLHVCRTADGVDACNATDATTAFVDAIRTESNAIKTILLQALYHISGSETGLVEILRAGGVEVCVELLDSSDPITQSNAARTLGFICFDDRGKQDALEFGAVPKILEVLKLMRITLSSNVKSNLLLALMSITSTDEGKRQCNRDDLINIIVLLLFDDDRIVKLNILKVISNIAVHPRIRQELVTDSACLSQLKKIRDSDDNLLKRHAEVAINATVWKP